MDTLDLLLLEAWNRISDTCRRAPGRVEALKRSRRRFNKTFSRPLRDWCLVIRASDTRINKDFGAVLDDEAVAVHEPHEVILPGFVIRELTKPVVIDWPGVTYAEAARRLGRTVDSLTEWVRKGVFRVERYREYGYPENGQWPGPKPTTGKKCLPRPRGPIAGGDPNNLWTNRGTGGGRPYVWSPSPINPNMFHGRAPHPVWGTLWQWQWEKLPEEYELIVRREPRWRIQMTKTGPRLKFMGWVCPGKMNADGEYSGCGKHCTYLYGPQTVWTLAKALMDGTPESETGFEMPEDSGLVGQWHPGVTDAVAAEGTRSFACKHCWNVHSPVMSKYTGWNDFITTISGGLLRGRDIRPPKDIYPMTRRKRAYKQRPRKRDADADAAARQFGATATG